MRAAISVEWLKLRRSRISLVTFVLVGLGCPALTAGFLAGAARGPADSPLAIKVNAMLIGEGWTAYFNLLTQMVSVAALLGPGVAVSWSFGREFSDATLSGLFALPTSRTTIAAAKFVVLTCWSLALAVLTLGAAIALAPVAELQLPIDAGAGPPFKVLLVALGAGLLAFPLALVATLARGHLPAVACLILIVVVTQIVTIVGLGGWFPYAAVSLWSGLGGAQAAEQVTLPQLLLVPATAAVGCAATLWRWRHMQVV